MSDATPRLSLPYLQVNQAEKEVTHNESLSILDVMVNATFIDQLVAPPGAFSEGDTFLVKATATGPWAGKENYIAKYQDAAWLFFAPFNGMLIMNTTSGALWKYLDSAWSIFTAGGNGTIDHNELSNRDLPEQHPIGAVTGLQTALNDIYDLEFDGGACGDTAFTSGVPAGEYVDGGVCGETGSFPSYIQSTEKNVANGVAGLDSNGFFNPKTPTSSTNAVTKAYVDVAVANAAPADGAELIAHKDQANGYLGANSAGLLPYAKLDDKFEYLTFEGNTTSTVAWWNSVEGVVVDRTVYIPNDFLGRLVNIQVSIKAPSSFVNGAWLPITTSIIQPLGNDYWRMGGNYVGAQGLGTGLFYRITIKMLKNG